MGSGQKHDATKVVTLPLIVREAAQEDIREAVDWYEHRSPGLGSQYLDRLDDCLSRVARNPELFPEVHRSSRMAVLQRFPYLVIYRVTPALISVIAVMHGSRHPRRWKERRDQ